MKKPPSMPRILPTRWRSVSPGGPAPAVTGAPRVLESVQAAGITWINIESPTLADLNLLSTFYPVHPLELDDCLSRRQLPKIDVHDDYVFVVLHIPRFLDERHVTVPWQICLFVGKSYLITVQEATFDPVSSLFDACKMDQDKRAELLSRGSGYILYKILDLLIDSLFPLLDRVLNDLDSIEDKVFDERVSATREVSTLRRDIADKRRIIFPVARMVTTLKLRARAFSEMDLDVYFDDMHDHVTKLWETLDACRERVEIFKDTDYTLNTEKSNKILAVLTIVFTLSIPATVVGSLYGMNVNLPGGIETGAWMFLGPYTTFFFLFLASIGAALGMALVFRKWGWF